MLAKGLLGSLLTLSVCLGAKTADRSAKFAQTASRHAGVIPLDSASYDEITSQPRDYSVTVVLTAINPKFQCNPCREFDPEYKLVAKSWAKSSASKRNKHFFAVLDFENGQEIYRRLELQTAPTILHFHPTEGPRASSENLEGLRYDFNKNGPKAEYLVNFLNQNSGLKIPFKRPTDYFKIATVVLPPLVCAAAVYMAWNSVKIFLFSKWLWCLATVIFIITMNSGYMWNQIRKPPSVRMGQDGAVQYFASGFQTQNGIETQFVGLLYAVIAFSVYILAVKLPGIEDPVRQRFGVYVWLGVFITMFSLLISIFRVHKNGGYPFKLLF